MSAGRRIRAATVSDAGALAGLRWQSAAEDGEPGLDQPQFARAFLAWMRAHTQSHLPFLAEEDGTAVGMAWLALAERVPTPTNPRRVGGDVQSVFVIPSLRGQGIGTQLIDTIIAAARDRSLRYLAVRTGHRNSAFYRRWGFDNNALVLELDGL